MRFINTDGMSFLGPGSEWFWAAVSAIAVVVTLLGIYRQIQLQTAVKETQQLAEIRQEWTSERYVRSRLAIWTAIRDEVPLVGEAGTWTVADYWDDLATLVRGGYLSKHLIQETVGDDIVNWWTILGPMIVQERFVRSVPTAYENFEWLAVLCSGDRHDHSYSKAGPTKERAEAMIKLCKEKIAIEESLRSVTISR